MQAAGLDIMAAKACYTPGGANRNELQNATNGYYYAPCDNTAEVSMCCAIGPGRDGNADNCLDSGLCGNVLLADGVVWRESCTDQTWEDPRCIKLFVNGTGINSTMGSSFDGEWYGVVSDRSNLLIANTQMKET